MNFVKKKKNYIIYGKCQKFHILNQIVYNSQSLKINNNYHLLMQFLFVCRIPLTILNLYLSNKLLICVCTHMIKNLLILKYVHFKYSKLNVYEYYCALYNITKLIAKIERFLL